MPHDAESRFRPVVILQLNHQPKTKIFCTMLDKIARNNKIMALVSIATLAIVAFVLVYKPYKAKKELAEA